MIEVQVLKFRLDEYLDYSVVRVAKFYVSPKFDDSKVVYLLGSK